ncbi:MAG: Flp pilus assembly complex ATPase component TadA [Planctomycetes bacterium]|nr:Flp pilus assembly complex ATPase component TadA [Planctomycetota bacterium]
MANIAGYNRKLTALMRKHGLVEEAALVAMGDKAAKEGLLLASLLITEALIDESTLIGLVSEDSGHPPIDLDKLKIELDDIRNINQGADIITEEQSKFYGVVPIAMVGDHLTLAVANPYDVIMVDNLKITVGKVIMAVVSTERAINKARELAYHAQEKAMESLMETMGSDGDEITVTEKPKEDDEGDLSAAEGDESPAVKLVRTIIAQAIQQGASDIHIEPFEKRVRVRFRKDGVLHEMFNPPKRLEKAMVSRIKIMTDTMNIAERGKPQDGRIQVKMAGNAIDIRVNSLPTVHGEKVCMRILNKSNLAGSLETLNFEPAVLDIVRRSIGAPYGMLLVTGPTGSGKSTTLYSCLRAVMTVEDNVNTVEDPVEYEIEGLNQCHVNPKRGLTFGAALRALLRQDPDTIMIGEIRDQETIEIAVKAALTGHLVLSTLHTNDAPSTIARIVDMGIEPFLAASTVLAIVAQRLGRRLCKNCKAPMPKEEMPSREQLLESGYKPEEIEGLALLKPIGCSLCAGGYKGRFALVECMEMTDDLRKAIIGGASTIDLRKAAIKCGMITLRRAGLMNAMRGVTSLEEVMRHTMGEEVGKEDAPVLKKAAGEGEDAAAEVELPKETAEAGT